MAGAVDEDDPVAPVGGVAGFGLIFGLLEGVSDHSPRGCALGSGGWTREAVSHLRLAFGPVRTSRSNGELVFAEPQALAKRD
ncbi:hypothetical protein GCM10027162_78020 [Streptomyces incanus]